jgi:hypothetical protein
MTDVFSAVLGALFAIGLGVELATRHSVLKQQGNNDITLTQCPELCAQLKQRWNEHCLADSDAQTAQARWLAALALVAALAVVSAILWYTAAVPVYGIWALIPAIVAEAALIAATGALAGASQGWIAAVNTQNEANGAVVTARGMLEAKCSDGAFVTTCENTLPACP